MTVRSIVLNEGYHANSSKQARSAVVRRTFGHLNPTYAHETHLPTPC